MSAEACVVSNTDDEVVVQLRVPKGHSFLQCEELIQDALNEAGDDSEGAITALRNVYREVKTQRVGVCADSLSRMAAGRSSDRS